MKYYYYLIVYILLQLLAWLVTPALPAFGRLKESVPIDNNSKLGVGTKLPKWLSWFDTPDNTLEGDNNFLAKNTPSYLSKVIWLYRNSLYGFKWTVLAAEVNNSTDIEYMGDPRVNRNNGVLGIFKATYRDYWQYKIVRKLIGNYGVMFNFGWQLDEFVKSGESGKALFQFSPRFVKIK